MAAKELFKELFKGPTGQYDSARFLFAIGGMSGILSPIVFQAYALWKGQSWDVLAFCTAYGGMLAAVLGFGGLGISVKDKGVASAMNTTPAPPIGGGQP